MNELISKDNLKFPGLIDLSLGTIHTVHNAFAKGIEQYGKEVDHLCMDLCLLFRYSAAGHEDFKELQVEMVLEMHNFQEHTELHWLGMGPFIKRIFEQWKAITHSVVELAKDPKN